MQVRSRLNLDYQLSIHDHIKSLLANLFTLIEHRCPDFTSDLVAATDELTMQADDINAFEETEAERVIHVEERTNRRVSETLLDQFVTGHRPIFVGA